VRAPSSADWIHRLQSWAENDDDIRLALLVGSQARAEMPADANSDIDVVAFARNPEHLLQDERWVAELGPYWTSHLESNALETGPERRVLFRDGQDVDFAVFPIEFVPALTRDERAADILRRGFRTLVNKDAFDLTVETTRRPAVPPTASEFSNLVNDYWFHLIWTAKKLRRGELLTALEATNGYLASLLVRGVRWHAITRDPAGPDVWHAGRFFEVWADPRVIRDFPATVAQYDAPSIARALKASRTLFGWLSAELGERLSHPTPLKDPTGISSYLDDLLGVPGR